MTIPHILTVGEQSLTLIPDAAHEYLMTTDQVALGYGVSVSTIREHKSSKAEELVEGKHFLSVSIPDARPGQGAQIQTLWTKRGVVRLGFFIRSKRARLFRDMAEDVVIRHLEQPAAPAATSLVDVGTLQRVIDLTAQAIESRAQVTEQKVMAELDQRLEQFVAEQPLDREQVYALQGLIQTLARLMGGKPVHYARAWSQLKDRFQVASYRDLQSSRFEEAAAFVRNLTAAYDRRSGLDFEVKA